MDPLKYIFCPSSNTNPEKEGIKTRRTGRRCWSCSSNTNPEKEGIKTLNIVLLLFVPASNTNPEKEGIKTLGARFLPHLLGLPTPTLKKKGLRLIGFENPEFERFQHQP